MVHVRMSEQKREWWAGLTPEARAAHVAKIRTGLEEGWKARGFWTDDRVSQLRALWGTMPVGEICYAMGFRETAKPTYMMVIGKAHRMGLPDYPKREAKPKPERKPRPKKPLPARLIDPWRGR